MRSSLVVLFVLNLVAGPILAQHPSPPVHFAIPPAWKDAIPEPPQTLPLYPGVIPNSKQAPDEERQGSFLGWLITEKISRPTITAYLPAPDKSVGSAVIIFPGGGYSIESSSMEGSEIASLLQSRGVAACIVKYRLPSDVTMADKAIGPLQDAQQAIRVVRSHASEWKVDPAKVGVMGFSAGGHLASTVGTHFNKAYLPDADSENLRPDFMVLVYPVISMSNALGHKGSREALLGPHPTNAQVRLFSNEEQVTDRTPPALLLHAADDQIVDVDNSVSFFEALRRHKVPVQLIVFPKGDHGFFLITRDDWMQPMFEWLTKNGWMKP